MFTTFAPRAIASASATFFPGRARRSARRRNNRRHYIWFGSILFWLAFWYFALVAVGVLWMLRIVLWVVTVALILVAQLVWWIVQSPWVLFNHDHPETPNRPNTHRAPGTAEGWAQKRWEERGQ